MLKKWDVFAAGDVNIDLIIPGVDRLPQWGSEKFVENMKTCVGGGAALFALGLGKLGIRTVFWGCIGDDCHGEFIRKEFADKNVDCSLLESGKNTDTGISLSFTNEKDRCFVSFQGENRRICPARADMSLVSMARHVHVTGYEGQKHEEYLEFVKRIKSTGGITVSFDVGWDDSGKWDKRIYEIFPYLDILFMNETEAIHYSRKETAEEGAETFAEYAEIVAVKLGKRGALGIQKGRAVTVPGFPAEAVDTTGAGDSFNAGFVYGFLKGESLERCLQYGNFCGGASVTCLGGNTGFPDREKLEKGILKGHRRQR